MSDVKRTHVNGYTWLMSKPGRASRWCNAMTLLGQIHETREPFTREAAQAIKALTLLVLGGWSPPMFGQINEALASAIPNAQRVTIADATHTMNVIKPAAYNEAVVNFLRG